MNRPLVRNALLLLAALTALGGGYWVAQSLRTPTGVNINTDVKLTAAKPMHEFSLPDLDGGVVSVNRWRGKLILLNFWATWCPPCLEEIPLFNRLQDRYGQTGFQVVGVAIDKAQDVIEFRNRVPMNYPVLIGDSDAMAIMQQYGNQYGSLPYSVLINPAGQITAQKLGAFSESELEKLLQSQLFPPAATPAI